MLLSGCVGMIAPQATAHAPKLLLTATIDLALDAMLADDPLAPVRAERRQYYLGGFDDGESAQAFADYLESLETSVQTPAGVVQV